MRTEITKRVPDSKYVVWGYIIDPTYEPADITEDNIQYISYRWVMQGVYSDKREAINEQQRLSKKSR